LLFVVVSEMKETCYVIPALGYEALPTGFGSFTKRRRVCLWATSIPQWTLLCACQQCSGTI